MKGLRPVVLLEVAFLLGVAACHNTFQGVKEDTRRDLDKTGQKLEKAGDKIDGHETKNDH